MGNINFSADMVGIQTLAQQGIFVDEGSVLSVGGSFEDMILQMISNNLTIDNVPASKQVTDILADEDEKNPQQLLMNALMSGMVAPEISVQDFSDIQFVNTEDVNVHPTYVTAASGGLYSDQVQLVTDGEADNNAEAETFTVAVLPKKTQFVKQFVNENVTKAEEFTTDVRIENKTENTPTVSIKSDARDVQQINVELKTDVGQTEYNNTENNNSDTMNTEQESAFISTVDMLRMRTGNKIDFSNEKVAVKVAQSPVNIESPNAVKDLADRILMRFNEKEFEVELYPKNLGKIAINLVLDNGIVRVAMSADNDKVNAFLASQSANIQSIVEKNTQYSAVVKVDDSQNQYQQQQRDNSQYGADENQKQRQQEHMQNMYRQNIRHTEDFLEMLNLV